MRVFYIRPKGESEIWENTVVTVLLGERGEKMTIYQPLKLRWSIYKKSTKTATEQMHVYKEQISRKCLSYSKTSGWEFQSFYKA